MTEFPFVWVVWSLYSLHPLGMSIVSLYNAYFRFRHQHRREHVEIRDGVHSQEAERIERTGHIQESKWTPLKSFISEVKKGNDSPLDSIV